jgi:hypothetical protein
MPATEYPIQQAVEDCADQLKAKLQKNEPAFVSVHFLCGIPDSPGYIRRSAGRAENCKLAEFADHQHNAAEQDRLHARALLEHVRAFDRKHTLLNLGARLSKAKGKDILLEITIATNEPTQPLQLEETLEDVAGRISIIVSSEFANLLAPESVSLEYLKAAYARAKNPSIHSIRPEYFTSQLDRARAEVFGRLLAAGLPDNFTNPMAEALDGSSDQERLWNLLSPIQSTAVYARGANGLTGTFTLCCIQMSDALGVTSLPPDKKPLVLVFSSAFERKWVTEVVKASFENGENKVSIANYLQLPNDGVPDKLKGVLEEGGRYSKEQIKILETEIKEAIQPLVSLPAQKNRLAALSWWTCLLAQKLHGRIHEGDALEFWFVVGEKAEFADDATFRLDKLLENERDRAALAAPLDDNKEIADPKLKAAIQYLEKEHFPWFSRGRHALLFDVSNGKLSPVGLLEVANSSWHQVLIESYKSPDEQRLKLPACVVVYVLGETHEAGLIRVNPSPQNEPRILRLMRFSNGRWQIIGSDKRKEVLLERVRAAMDGDDAIATKVTKTCLRVADDLSIGGTLVFTDNETSARAFLELGQSWTFGDSLEDRVPLIAHDGATVLYRNGEWKWLHRRLLTPTEMMDGVKDEIQKWSLDYLQRGPLNGVGTRRWSAALTALRNEVRLVVVISQDGGMTCWWADRDKKKKKATALNFQNLPLEGDPEPAGRFPTTGMF